MEIKKGIIYGLFDPRKVESEDDCRYVGQSTHTAHDRLNGHRSEARGRSTRYVCNWFRKVMREGFDPIIIVFQTMDVIDDDRTGLSQAERRWIAHGRAEGWRLTNDTDGGEGTSGWHPSLEQRAKISAIMKGVPKSPEHRAKISAFMKTQPLNPGLVKATEERRGKPLPEATRKKQSESMKTSERAKKHWESMKGRTLSDSHRSAISTSQTNNPKIIANAIRGGNEFKRKFETDPEFAEAWRVANGAATLEGGRRMRKKRMQCDECGMISNPQGIGHHQTTFKHTGKTLLEPTED